MSSFASDIAIAMNNRRFVAPVALVLWFAFAYLAVRPLAEAPVVDSWIYAEAVR